MMNKQRRQTNSKLWQGSRAADAVAGHVKHSNPKKSESSNHGRRNWTSRHGEDAMAANTQAKTDRARCGRRGGVYFSAAPQPVAEMLPGRLRVLRIPEAPRACLAKIRPERAESVYFSAALQPVAEKLQGRRRVFRLPEAPQACSAKIRAERVQSACVFP